MTADEIMQSYAEVRGRLWGNPAPKPIQKAVIPPPPPKEDPIDFVQESKTRRERYKLEFLWMPDYHDLIIKNVVKKHSVSMMELTGRTRRHEVVNARHEIAYRLRMELGYSFPMIGKLLGDRDHTTAMASFRRYEKRLQESGDNGNAA